MSLIDIYKDITDSLESEIQSAKDGSIIELPKGKVVLSRKIYIKGKNNFTLKGNDTTILSTFDPHIGFSGYSGIFSFEDCNNITIENLKLDTTLPVNSSGTVISVDAEKGTFDIEFFEDCILDGSQTIFGINSIDDNGTPDSLYATTKLVGIPYEMLSDKTARIYSPEYSKDSLVNLPTGERVCLRHGIGFFDILSNSAITFKNCNDTVITDLTMYSSAGFAIVVFPRCNNMTIERYRVEVPKGSNRLMASNIDGIHLFGLTGKLILRDCYFDGLGDDALNIHSTAGFVTNVDKKSINVINKRFLNKEMVSKPLPENWCRKGDTIIVYDNNFAYKGSFKVQNYSGVTITFTELDFDIEVGDVLANKEYYAATEVIGCEVRNSRARALVLQTENILIKDCKFYGIASPAILLAPDITRWFEVGPVNNCVIENCLFEKCACSRSKNPQLGVIVAKVGHSSQVSPDCSEGVHKNITIKNNIFENSAANIIFMQSVYGINIENNISDGESLSDDTITLIDCQ